MTLRLAWACWAFATFPALALEAPATLENARVETRAGVTPAAALEQAAREKGATWVGWSVDAIPRLGDVCCFSNNFKARSCTLAERESSWGTTDNHARTHAEVYVLVETRDGDPSRVKVLSADCHVDGADRRVVWLGPVETQASLAALDRLVDRSDKKVSETALVAIAYHQDARADALLEKRALDRSLRSGVREQAIFWSGQTRGASGLKTLDRVLATETDGDLRQHAVFAMSQSDEPSAIDRIKRVAVEDKDPEVRGHALFSLSQTKAPVGEWIVSRLDAERDEEVRDQAVFALSQLDDGTDWLLKVLRSKRDPDTVRKALFWLGQSDDPRALHELESILDR